MSSPSEEAADTEAEVHLVPAESAGYALLLSSLAWQRAARDKLKPHGITQMQFGMLAGAWWLRENGHVSTQRQIATYMGVDEQMTGQIAKRLETAGLIRRERRAEDGRARDVLLTTKGTKVLSAAAEDMIQLEEEFFDMLGDNRDAFVAGLRQITRTLYKIPSATGAI